MIENEKLINKFDFKFRIKKDKKNKLRNIDTLKILKLCKDYSFAFNIVKQKEFKKLYNYQCTIKMFYFIYLVC